MIYTIHQYFYNLQNIFTNYPLFKKNIITGNKNNQKNIFSKAVRKCRDVKTQRNVNKVARLT